MGWLRDLRPAIMAGAPNLMALLTVAAGGAALAGWWSFQNLDAANASVLKIVADQDAERALRSSAGAAVLLLAIGVWRLLVTPAKPRVAGEDDPEFARVRAILAEAECAE